ARSSATPAITSSKSRHGGAWCKKSGTTASKRRKSICASDETWCCDDGTHEPQLVSNPASPAAGKASGSNPRALRGEVALMATHSIAAIDVGTTKVCTIVAEVTPFGELRILGVGIG